MRKLLFALALVCVASPVRAADVLDASPSAVTVHDGDTIIIENVRLRLEGIDAPELAQPLGERSRDELAAIIADGKTLVCDVAGGMTYGRPLATCWTLAGLDIGQELVRRGFAFCYDRYSRAYCKDEDAARAARVGMWISGDDVIPPWTWRKAKRNF